MHPDLAPHLHTPECNKIIDELHNCHKTHAFAKFVGICNDIDRVLNVCLSGEREQNRQANKQKSQAMKDKLYANQKQSQN
ncbi:unnamed protein product [Diamesa serratosioi]